MSTQKTYIILNSEEVLPCIYEVKHAHSWVKTWINTMCEFFEKDDPEQINLWAAVYEFQEEGEIPEYFSEYFTKYLPMVSGKVDPFIKKIEPNEFNKTRSVKKNVIVLTCSM